MKPEQCLLELSVANNGHGLDAKSCKCCCHCKMNVKVEADHQGQQSKPTAEDCFVGVHVSAASDILENEFGEKRHVNDGFDMCHTTKQHLELKPSSEKNFSLNGRVKEERASSTSDMVSDFTVKTEDEDETEADVSRYRFI